MVIEGNGKDISARVSPFFEKDVQIENIDMKFFSDENIIVHYNDGTEMKF